MRRLLTLALGLGAALLVSPSVSAQEQQDADRKVAGGITAPGWTGKEDAGNKQGLTVKTRSSPSRARASG